MPLLSDVVDVDLLAYARGSAPSAQGSLRVRCDDFHVEEDCDIALDDAGEHLWLWVEKTDLTTPRALEILSGLSGVHPRYIGYAGLKDRRAVTRQWFSLVWPIKTPLPAWPERDDLRVLVARRHGRKLKRGAHRGNRFVIRVRDLSTDESTATITDDLMRVRDDGVPNYFGAQRFGRDGGNIALSRALFAGRRLSRNRRGFALSAARSLVFNAVVDARVRAGNWNRPLAGDVCMLDGSQSVFAWVDAGESAATLAERMEAQDLHPAAPLPGRPTSPAASDDAAALEAAVGEKYQDLIAGLVAAGVDADQRSMRLLARELDWSFKDNDLIVSFWLPSGAFATSVLREFVRVREATGEG